MRDDDRSAGSAVGVRRVLDVLDAAEILDHFLERPGVVGEFGPLVVVGGESAHPHHRVHRRRAAEHLAARPVDRPPTEPGLRLGQVVPIHLAAKQFREGGGDVRELVLVLTAGLEDRDLAAGVGAEPVGQHGTCRTRPPRSRSRPQTVPDSSFISTSTGVGDRGHAALIHAARTRRSPAAGSMRVHRQILSAIDLSWRRFGW